LFTLSSRRKYSPFRKAVCPFPYIGLLPCVTGGIRKVHRRSKVYRSRNTRENGAVYLVPGRSRCHRRPQSEAWVLPSPCPPGRTAKPPTPKNLQRLRPLRGATRATDLPETRKTFQNCRGPKACRRPSETTEQAEPVERAIGMVRRITGPPGKLVPFGRAAAHGVRRPPLWAQGRTGTRGSCTCEGPHSGVQVPAKPNIHRPATKGACAVTTRGGKLPELNPPSVTPRHA